MTLSELLNKIPFDDIAVHIPKYNESNNSLASYKMHYDLLKNLDGTPQQSSEIVFVEYDTDECYKGLLIANDLESMSFENAVKCEISIRPEVTASEAEIAACCLWHTSYFGFTQEQRSELIDNLYDHVYNTKFKEYTLEYKDFLPTRKELLRNPAIHKEIRTAMQAHRTYKADREDKYMPSLYIKRAWRKWKRHEINMMYHDRIKSIGKFLNLLPDKSKAYELFRVSDYYTQNFRINISDIKGCQDYLNELSCKYGVFQDLTLDECIVVVSNSDSHPIKSKTEISQLISKGLNLKNVEFIYRTVKGMGPEIKVDAMFYQR